MIINHIVEGTLNTSFHDFSIAVNGMVVTISPGSYYRAGTLVFTKGDETNFTIPNGEKNHEIYITTNGIELFSFSSEQGYVMVPNIIDKLAWFNVKDETDLIDLEIHFVKIHEPYTV